jgi:hypothetical protein
MPRQIIRAGGQSQKRSEEFMGEPGRVTRGGPSAPPPTAGSASSVPAGMAATPDTYFERLWKYIPTETVAFYMFVDGIIKGVNPINAGPILAGLTVVLMGLNVLYLQRVQKVTSKQQLILSTVAFLVWLAAIGGPFLYIPGYAGWTGSIALGLFSFLLAIYEPTDAPTVAG